MKSLISMFKRQFFFSEVNSVIKLSSKRLLQVEDLTDIPKKRNGNSLENISINSSWKFIKSIIQLNRKPILFGLLFTFFRVFFALSIPVIIKLILEVVTSDGSIEEGIISGLFYSGLFAVATILSGIVINQCFYWDFVCFQAYQRMIDSMVYRHLLVLSPKARSKFRAGDLINRVGTDSQAISKMGFLVNDLFYVVLLFIGVIILLLNFLGIATFAALGTLIIFNPIAWKLVKHFEKFDSNKARLRESRLNLLSQVLTGMRTVKLYNLTNLLESKIRNIRSEEVKQQILWGSKSALSIVIFGSTTTLVCLSAFGFRILLNQPLDPTILFPSLGLLMLLEVPFAQLPEIISGFSSVKASSKRVLNFLTSSNNNQSEKFRLSNPGEALGLRLENMSFSESVDQEILKKINISINPGETVAVVGPIGSGKSLFLRSLLEEDERVSGLIKWEGLSSNCKPRIAYVPQEAFIFNATIKENLLMGYDELDGDHLLERALKVTTLETDMQQLKGGLEMEIGERGIGLSGGQKQRISLARAVIAKPAVAVLDDPFSALDSKTESQIIENLLFSEWNGITQIVATHRLRYLHRFDKILFLKEGRAVSYGTLDELLLETEFKDFYSKEHIESKIPSETEKFNELTKDESGQNANSLPKIIENEHRTSGRVDKKSYRAFLTSMVGGNLNPYKAYIFLALAFSVLFAVLAPLLQNLWFVVLSDPGSLAKDSILRKVAENSGQSIAIYAGLGVLSLIVIYYQRTLWNRQAAIASGILHDNGLAAVIRSSIRYFDSTPSGVLMNRFTKDVNVIENDLRWMFENMVRFTLQAFVNLILVLFVVPWLILGIVPIIWVYFKLQQKFSTASREVKRLVQVTQSPLFSHLRETFDGIISVHVLDKYDYFKNKFNQRHVLFQKVSRAHELIDRWFSVRVPVLSGLISLLSAISIFIAAKYDFISAGLAGVILTYLINFWTLLNWSARTFAMVEGNLTSVEKLVQLTELPSETELFNQGENKIINDLDKTGELKGASIEFISASVRYAENLPNVLKDISFRVSPGNQVGIIGRTGSGKSTILQVLVGMAQISSGDILIDEVPIRQIPLSTLRKIVAVVPQDPFLFDGTIRLNLDPAGIHTDEKLLKAIQKIGLSDLINSLEDGLDTSISESKGNLSQGQKQLLCFARALLKKPKIIIMDEATSSVDVQTEIQIQRKLKSALEGITVLVIAHRTSTVQDSNQIIRLSAGVIENIS